MTHFLVEGSSEPFAAIAAERLHGLGPFHHMKEQRRFSFLALIDGAARWVHATYEAGNEDDEVATQRAGHHIHTRVFGEIFNRPTAVMFRKMVFDGAFIKSAVSLKGGWSGAYVRIYFHNGGHFDIIHGETTAASMADLERFNNALAALRPAAA